MIDLRALGLESTSVVLLEARAAVGRDARHNGVTVTPPSWIGSDYYMATSGTAEPLAGLKFAHDRLWGAQTVLQEYIYQARQAGHSWDAIGLALGMEHEENPGAIAFEYAIAQISRPFVHRDTFAWICPGCQRSIKDRGPADGPPGEPGHDPACPRLAQLEGSPR